MNPTEEQIPNPYEGHDRYHCFGCDPHSPVGLRLTFLRDGDVLRSRWTPRSELEGYPGVIHGGIQATLADEVGGWFIHVMKGTAGMTRDLHIEYHRPAATDDAPFTIEARETSSDAKSCTLEIELRGASGALFSTTTCTYAVFSEAVARKRLSFPGREAFQPAPKA